MTRWGSREEYERWKEERDRGVKMPSENAPQAKPYKDPASAPSPSPTASQTQCLACKGLIEKKAKTCPHCGKKFSLSLPAALGLAFGLPVAILILAALGVGGLQSYFTEKSPKSAVKSATPAWNEPNSFRGLPFGQDLTSLAPQCSGPSWERSSTCWTKGFDLTKDGSFQTYDISFGKEDPLVLFVDYGSTAYQFKGRLYSIHFDFSSSNFSNLLAIFREKYGPPTSLRIEPWQSKGGVKTEAAVSSWIGKHVSIELRSLAKRIDQGSGWISTNDEGREKHWDLEKQRERKSLGKAL